MPNYLYQPGGGQQGYPSSGQQGYQQTGYQQAAQYWQQPYNQQGAGAWQYQQEQSAAQMQQAAAQMQQAAPQMQTVSFIQVRSREEADGWPIAPGNTVIFKQIGSPYCYFKSKSYNSFADPEVDVYMRVDQTAPQQNAAPMQQSAAQTQQAAPPPTEPVPQEPPRYASDEDLNALRGVVDGLRESMGALHREIEHINVQIGGIAARSQSRWGATRQEGEEDE